MHYPMLGGSLLNSQSLNMSNMHSPQLSLLPNLSSGWIIYLSCGYAISRCYGYAGTCKGFLLPAEVVGDQSFHQFDVIDHVDHVTSFAIGKALYHCPCVQGSWPWYVIAAHWSLWQLSLSGTHLCTMFLSGLLGEVPPPQNWSFPPLVLVLNNHTKIFAKYPNITHVSLQYFISR